MLLSSDMVESKNIQQTRNVLTVALLIDLITFFIADLFVPDSHFRSSVWPLHSRVHVGAAAMINGVYIFMGLYYIWRPSFDLVHTMRWVASWIATWNVVFLAFALLAAPLMLEAGDVWANWQFEAAGAGNDPNTAVEGWAFAIVGIPTLPFFYVLWRLRHIGKD